MSKSTPKAPDYQAAAETQAQSSKDVTEQQTWANRADQFTPFGKQTWQETPTWDPVSGQYINKWAQTTTLNPESQRALDAQMGLSTGRSELGGEMMGRISDEFGQPVDWSNFQEGGQNVQGGSGYNKAAEDAIYGKWASRALPEQELASEAKRTQLYNMGLKEGDAAYDREMEKLGQVQSDAMQQAQYQATIGAGSEASRMQGQDVQASALATQNRQQQIAEELQKRGWSLNEVNALISGQQVGMPSMPGYNTAAASQPVQSLTAANMQQQGDLAAYNAKQQALQGMMSGAGSMAGAGMMMG